jgi:putative inorganic carbon (HCO3(-)) transporter
LALLVGLVVLLALARPKLLPIVAGIAVLGGIAYLVWPNLFPRSWFDWNNPASVVQSLDYRLTLWRLASPLILEAPLVGTGLAGYPRFAEARFPPMLGEVQFSHAHNLFLQVALDTGLIGAFAFLAMMVIGVLGVWIAYRSNRERTLAIGVLAGFTMIVAHGSVDMLYWGTKPGIVFWLMLGLAAAFGFFTERQITPRDGSP